MAGVVLGSANQANAPQFEAANVPQPSMVGQAQRPQPLAPAIMSQDEKDSRIIARLMKKAEKKNPGLLERLQARIGGAAPAPMQPVNNVTQGPPSMMVNPNAGAVQRGPAPAAPTTFRVVQGN